MTLGERIKQNRKSLGMTQDELAKHVGVSRRTIIDWENDKTSTLRYYNYEKINEVLSLGNYNDQSIEVLLSGNNSISCLDAIKLLESKIAATKSTLSKLEHALNILKEIEET